MSIEMPNETQQGRRSRGYSTQEAPSLPLESMIKEYKVSTLLLEGKLQPGCDKAFPPTFTPKTYMVSVWLKLVKASRSLLWLL